MPWTLPRSARLAIITVLAVVTTLASGCTSSGPTPAPPPPVSVPVPGTGEITLYLSLPASTAGLDQSAAKAAMPRSATYRRFMSPAAAASRFGATDTQIEPVAKSVQGVGLQFAADPTRLFARATGSAQQGPAA